MSQVKVLGRGSKKLQSQTVLESYGCFHIQTFGLNNEVSCLLSEIVAFSIVFFACPDLLGLWTSAVV